jgi:L,D-transpeptidase ErfK/SrfK
MRLFHFQPGKEAVSYAIGIGREGLLTPVGTTTIRAKKVGPTWRPTPRMRKEDPTLPEFVPPGPANPMGTHVMYLNWPEYGIHGTDKPYGIGRRVSSGCIRMYPEGIVNLYPTTYEGETVTVVDQPVLAAWIDNRLYIEAHPTMRQADIMEAEGGLPTYEVSTPEMEVVLRAAGAYRSLVDWQKVRQIIRERRGYPIVIAERPAEPATAAPETTTAEPAAAGPS